MKLFGRIVIYKVYGGTDTIRLLSYDLCIVKCSVIAGWSILGTRGLFIERILGEDLQ